MSEINELYPDIEELLKKMDKRQIKKFKKYILKEMAIDEKRWMKDISDLKHMVAIKTGRNII